ncbi:MAG: XRE family transcriptional regulator [Sporolactobacillus sp.]
MGHLQQDLIKKLNEGIPLAAAVGARMKKIRTARDLSLNALAERTTLGKGTLSEIERGLRNPTLDTLFAITKALSVPLSAVLCEQDGSDLVHLGRLAVHGQSVDAILIDRWNEPGGVREVYRVTISERMQRSNPHARGVKETLTLLSGTALVGTIDNPRQVHANESICFAGDQLHQYGSLNGKALALLVMFYPREA